MNKDELVRIARKRGGRLSIIALIAACFGILFGQGFAVGAPVNFVTLAGICLIYFGAGLVLGVAALMPDKNGNLG